MKKLYDMALILRSKNAGPLYITFDIIFSNKELFDYVIKSEAINKKKIASLYDVELDKIDIIPYEIVNSIKITIPRRYISGSLEDMDIYGCQQHVPLANIIIP